MESKSKKHAKASKLGINDKLTKGEDAEIVKCLGQSE